MLRTFQGCFNEISKKFQASFKRARDGFMEVSNKYFMAISRVFSKVFQRVFIFSLGCLKIALFLTVCSKKIFFTGVSKVFQW